jgi:bromodomain-containing protein 7/9
MSQLRIHAPIPVTVPSNRPTPILSTLSSIPSQPTPIATTSAPSARPPKKRRHWTIVRNATARSRAKDKESEATLDDAKTTWKVPRDVGPTDYGTFAAFLGELAASAVGPNTVGGMSATEYIYGSEHRLFATIRSTIEHRGMKRKHEAEEGEDEDKETTETFWTDERAEEAWDYLRDVVYGGADGYAYVRSLAEFVAPSVYLSDVRKDMDADEDGDDRGDGAEDVDVTTPPEDHDAALPLGVPLGRYVEDNLVDTVTCGRHGWLRDVFLPAAAIAIDPAYATLCGDGPTSPFRLRASALPGAARAVASFRAWSEEQLDMASLIRKPEELAKEGVLEGGPGEGGEHAEIARALTWGVEVIEELSSQAKKDIGENEGGDGNVGVKAEAVDDARVAEEEEEEEEANAMDVDPDAHPIRSQSQPKPEPDAEEDPVVKRLRMNLLALAKRAPLDRIAKLPIALVPEDIRGIVPTA